MFDLGKSNRRDTEQIAFRWRPPPCRGIQRVVAHVLALVDAGHDQIQACLASNSGQRQMNAIRWRAVHEIKSIGRAVQR